MKCNNKKNEFPIIHDGTSQGSRLPFALDPQYVKVDERSDADTIVFARAYSKLLQFYNNNNTLDGDWSPFWTKNPAIVLATLASARVDWFREETRLMINEIQNLDNNTGLAADDDLLQQNFGRLFDAVTNLAWQLDFNISQLPEDLPFRISIKNLIQTRLAPALRAWISWYKQTIQIVPAPFPLIDINDTFLLDRVKAMKILGEPLEPSSNVWNNNTFSNDWITDTTAANWTDYVNNIPADLTIFPDPPGPPTIGEHINFAVGHTFFKNTFETFLQGYAKAVQEAQLSLLDLLKNYDKHEPHFALYLTFVRLLRKERSYLNRFTDRHLRFYYERVLRLKPSNPVASRAHVIVELAKNVDQHLLPKGTLLKAGKDANGQEMYFTLEEDFVANKAQVTSLKSILKLPDDPNLYNASGDQPAYKNIDHNRYYAAEASNTADGIETELEGEAWHPFGNKNLDGNNEFWEVAIPPEEIGFALASHYLYLTEGTRTIELSFDGLSGGSINGLDFRIELTIEEGWFAVDVPVVDSKLTFTLAGDVPAILPYQAAVHAGSFTTEFPVLKATLINDPTSSYAYEAVKNIQMDGVSIMVAVDNKQSLALSGSTGPLDNSKPFHPFGPAPANKAVFYVGDKEVFQKNAAVTLKVAWKETYATNQFFPAVSGTDAPAVTTNRYELIAGSWEPATDADDIINGDVDTTGIAFQVSAGMQSSPNFGPNEIYTTTTPNGFVKFELDGDFGHSDYPLALAEYAGSPTTIDLPKTPFDAQLISCSIDYTASIGIPLSSSSAHTNQGAQFFHLHPFGLEEIELEQSGPISFLPTIAPQDVAPINNIGKDAGDWIIGISNLVPPQTLSLLVQVFEGSANPLIEKPESHIQWSYLIGNTWKVFEENELVDGTNGLLQSGIIQFSIPKEASDNSTILPSGQHWLKASVQSAVDAVCQIISVQAQATTVQLQNLDFSLVLETLPFAPGSIKKLLNPDSAVKKITQPYSSFDGRLAETSDSFYTRISERLRHKNRAITLWDYERMVLQEFPFAHKVKCLNHLQYQPNENDFIYKELAPGHVTVIVIPNSNNQAVLNPLRPYTSLGNLELVDAFLQKHISCFVNLHVRNPLFEEVQAKFKVKLHPGFDETFYAKLLNDEIIQFLSPWAFESGVEIGFGGKIYKSALINFIEERIYVDYLLDFELLHLLETTQPDQEVIQASTLVSILVSAAQHDIELIEGDPNNVQGEDCRCEDTIQTNR